MPEQDCLLTIALTHGAGGHDIGYDAAGQDWSFPLDYEFEGGPPSSALISFDDNQQMLKPGQQQITGTGKVVTVAWKLGGESSGVLFRSNPYNQESAPASYPIIDNIVNEHTAEIQVGVAVPAARWTVETVVINLPGGSASEISLLVDGNKIADLPTGYSSHKASGSVVQFFVSGVERAGIEIRYNLTQAA